MQLTNTQIVKHQSQMLNCPHHDDGLPTIQFWTTRLPNGMTKTQESQQHGYGNVVIRQPQAHEMHTKRFLMQNLEGQITNFKTKKHNMKSPQLGIILTSYGDYCSFAPHEWGSLQGDQVFVL